MGEAGGEVIITTSRNNGARLRTTGPPAPT